MLSLEKMISRYVGFVSKRPRRIFLALGLITIFAAIGTFNIFGEIRTDLKALLPQNTPSVLALEESEARRGSNDLYIIAVQSPDPYKNQDYIVALAREINAYWPEVQWTQTNNDASFFREHALLYLPEEHLESFRDRLRLALRCELQRVNVGFVELGDDCDEIEQTEWTVDAWLTDDLYRELGLPNTFFGEWDDGPEEPTEEDPAIPDTDIEQTEENAPIPEDLENFLIASDGDNYISLIYVQLDKPSTEIEFANEMELRGRELIESLLPASFHPQMTAEVVGPYQSFNEARTAIHDSVYALFASIIFVILILFLYFRLLRALIIVITPLLVGLIWTMGFSYLCYGELNLYTMFVGSVLVGMGIDFGIHLYSRALECFENGNSWEDALIASLTHTGTALLAAAFTTVGALLTLTFSHFQGFKEFGVIASYGILFCMAAYYLLLPPIILILERWKPMQKSRKRRKLPHVGPRFWIWTAACTIAIALCVSLLAPFAEFEYDFRNLRGPSSQASIRYGLVMGKSRSGSPSIILAQNPGQIHEIQEQLRYRFAVEQDPYLKGFITLETYLPPNQADRMAIIRQGTGEYDPFDRGRPNDIASVVNRSAYDRLEGEAAEFVSILRDLVNIEPFTLSQIPPWAYRTLLEADGSVGNLGIIFRGVNVWDIREVQDYQSRYQSFELSDQSTIPVADATFISADIIETVQADGKRMGLFVLIVLTLVLMISLKSWRGALICLIALGAGFSFTLAIMVLSNTRIGMYNMVVLPAVLGVSVDGAIHLYHRTKEEGISQINRVMKSTGVAVTASSLTTAAGFAGLLFQQHLGIRSIGELALIGILAALSAVMLIMPGTLILFGKMNADEISAE
jgi:hypothetical protein